MDTKFGITDDGALLPADSHGRVPSNVREVQGFAFTLAPAAYDYWYTHTAVDNVECSGKTWRLVAFTDSARFEQCQMDRYGSGLFPTVWPDDEERCELFALPTAKSLLKGL